MRDDSGVPVACPLCAATLQPLHSYSRTRTMTVRGLTRKAVYAHLMKRHPGLSDRERSLLADQAVDGCAALIGA